MKPGYKHRATICTRRPHLLEIPRWPQPGYGTIQQGYLEGSNVDPVQEITNLISAQRNYEMNSKIIQATDEMYQTITKNNL
jgi:flagellar basal body rod protein FlgG